MAQVKTSERPASLTIKVLCSGQEIAVGVMALRSFSTGKVGYGFYGKTILPNGETVQAACNFVIPHSETK